MTRRRERTYCAEKALSIRYLLICRRRNVKVEIGVENRIEMNQTRKNPPLFPFLPSRGRMERGGGGEEEEEGEGNKSKERTKESGKIK